MGAFTPSANIYKYVFGSRAKSIRCIPPPNMILIKIQVFDFYHTKLILLLSVILVEATKTNFCIKLKNLYQVFPMIFGQSPNLTTKKEKIRQMQFLRYVVVLSRMVSKDCLLKAQLGQGLVHKEFKDLVIQKVIAKTKFGRKCKDLKFQVKVQKITSK